MTYYPYGPEVGAFYKMSGQVVGGLTASVASFNDPEDADFCGVLTEITGLDSADVRDTGDVNAGADGGWTGTNFYGRRPITMTGTMYGYNTTAERNAQMAKIRGASDAMVGNGILSWLNTDAGAPWMGTTFRRQQPTRFSGGWIKTFNISLVSSVAPLLDLTPTLTPSYLATTIVENRGDYQFLPPLQINIQGPTSGTLQIVNSDAGGSIAFLPGYTLGTEYVVVYPQTRQAYNVTTSTWVTQYIDFVNSTWFGLQHGNNTITASSGALQILYNSAWV